jgi:nitrilase
MAIVAAVQATPVFLDRSATTERACELVKQAAAAGAELVLFPEAFIPAYPDWVWRLPAWSDSHYTTLLRDQAVDVPGPTTDRLGEAAREAGAYVAIGMSERAGGTLYNTLLYLGPDGSIIGRHRKLQATGGERSIWGSGDGSGLEVIATPFGVVGGLICWENYMPLARAAMYARGIDVLLAPTWDNSPVWVPTLQHIAKEGRVYVIGVSPFLQSDHVPEQLRGDIYRKSGDWMSRGNATVVGPDGEVIAGPLIGEEGILYADVDVDAVRRARHEFDPVGHYARSDVFTLHVNTRPQRGVTFDG